jgi:molybdopterin-guanine dinucleotide biosynthesis protein
MNELFVNYKRFGIFGASESGKTTLAKKISYHFWQTERRPSIVLDCVSKSNWGAHAAVFVNEEKFWKYIFEAKNALIVVDDASVTINRDNELNGVFTTMRHQGHKLLVIGHSAGNLLPQMREQLQRIFLFLQNEDSIKKWENVFPTADLQGATQLKQYEFLTVANYSPAKRFALTK